MSFAQMMPSIVMVTAKPASARSSTTCANRAPTYNAPRVSTAALPGAPARLDAVSETVAAKMTTATGAPTAMVASGGSRPRSRPCKRGDGPAARGGSAIGRATEPPLPLLELNDRGEEVIASEVGPQDIREVELGVRRLPEQEIGKPLLTAGPDDQVGIREIRRVQLGGERRVVNGVGRQGAVPRTGGEAAAAPTISGPGPEFSAKVQ